MKRRDFIRTVGAAGLGIPALFVVCRKKIMGPQISPDIILTEDEQATTQKLVQEFPKLEGIVRSPGKEYRIGFGGQLLKLSFEKDDHRLKMVKGDGDTAYLTIGRKTGALATPAVRFEDRVGNVLIWNDQTLEFGFDYFHGIERGPRDWWSVGLKLVALGLAIWLGAKIAGFILAAIAFLAGTAALVGAIIIGFIIVRWILEKFGWNFDRIKEFFQDLVERILALLREIAGIVEG